MVSDHDLLIRIDERLASFDERLSGHLRRHWIITVCALTAVLAAAGGLLAPLLMR